MAPKVRLRDSDSSYAHGVPDLRHEGGPPTEHTPHFIRRWLFHLALARGQERLANSTTLRRFVAI
jgi:hypothetical protein